MKIIPRILRGMSVDQARPNKPPAQIIADLILFCADDWDRKHLNTVAQALDWLIENDRPGLWLNATVRDLMQKRIKEREGKA